MSWCCNSCSVIFSILLTQIPQSAASTYWRYSTKLNWTDANIFCGHAGTTLASIHSQSDFNDVQSLCNETKPYDADGSCYIGLTDSQTEGIWEWSDGSTTDYGFTNNNNSNPTTGILPWHTDTDEPNNLGNEDCVAVWKVFDYNWNDINCGNVYYPICNWPTGDTYHLYAISNIYVNVGRVTGVESWGRWKNGGAFHQSLGSFDFSVSYGNVSIGTDIGDGADDFWNFCDPFSLDVDDYINGYRVIWGTYVYGLYFYTNNGKEYNCTSDPITPSHSDSGIIIYENQYLSGFIFTTGTVMDGIQLQFDLVNPTSDPTMDPSIDPTTDPTIDPTIDPSTDPTLPPTTEPTSEPTTEPSAEPTAQPTTEPTSDPSIEPTAQPSTNPTTEPTLNPSSDPTNQPYADPTNEPTTNIPTAAPSFRPSHDPTTGRPTVIAVQSKPTTAAPVRDSGSASTPDPTAAPNTPNSQKQDGGNIDNSVTIVIAICVTLVIIAAMVMIVCIVKSRDKNESKSAENNMANLDTAADLEKVQSGSNAVGDGDGLIKGKPVIADRSGPGFSVEEGAEEETGMMNAVIPEAPQVVSIFATQNGDHVKVDVEVSSSSDIMTPEHPEAVQMVNLGEDEEKDILIVNDEKDTDELQMVDQDKDIVEDINDFKESAAGRVQTTMDENILSVKVEVEKWLNSLNLGKYVEIFVLSGYTSIEMIKGIDHEEILRKIGVEGEEDLNALMIGIQGLRNDFEIVTLDNDDGNFHD